MSWTKQELKPAWDPAGDSFSMALLPPCSHFPNLSCHFEPYNWGPLFYPFFHLCAQGSFAIQLVPSLLRSHYILLKMRKLAQKSPGTHNQQTLQHTVVIYEAQDRGLSKRVMKITHCPEHMRPIGCRLDTYTSSRSCDSHYLILESIITSNICLEKDNCKTTKDFPWWSESIGSQCDELLGGLLSKTRQGWVSQLPEVIWGVRKLGVDPGLWLQSVILLMCWLSLHNSLPTQQP